MAFFMLFNVPKTLEYSQLKKEFSRYGTIKFFLLKDDMKKKEFKFGQIDYSEIRNKKDFLAFLKEKGIQSSEKESKSSKKEPKIQKQYKQSKSTISNLSFFYYKDTAYGKGIENFQLTQNYNELFNIANTLSFELTTTYPGLLVGSGYNHPKLKDNDEDYQLGFFFDHTTGLPLIPGSSVKGLIRSIFPSKGDTYYKEKIEYLKEEYHYTFDENSIKDIFDNNADTIFYDAYIVKTGNNDNKILGNDFITSHFSNEKNGEFKEPNPVKFLKILPEVTFKFQFKCSKNELIFFRKLTLIIFLK